LPDAYTAAFQHWKSVRARLAHNIQDYVDACAMLESAFAAPPLNWASRRLFDQALSGLDLELPSLLSDEQTLQKTRTALSMTRNSSQALAPINALPSEILAIIFSLASRRCLENDLEFRGSTSLVSPIIISSVCALWRQVSFDSHSLWSHLDLTPSGPTSNMHYLRAEFWACRSHKSPLHVDIYESEDEAERNQHGATQAEVQRLVTFLTPLMPRVRELEIILQDNSQLLMNSVLGCWIRHCSAGSARMLKIWHNEEQPGIDLQGPYVLPEGDSILSNTSERFFSSLDTVALQNSRVSWSSAMFEGLVELRIDTAEDSRFHPTQSQIAGVLAASPRLRSLMLINIAVEMQPGFVAVPIAMNHLEILSLESSNGADFSLLLPLISHGSDSICMSLTLDDDPSFIAEARSFLRRSKVTTLHADGGYPLASIAALLGPIPHLRTLALKGCELSGSTLHDFIQAGDTSDHDSDPWPQLHSLYVLACTTSRQQILQLASLHLVQTLRVIRGNIIGGYPWRTPEERRALEGALSQTIPDVLCWDDSNKDPTSGWDFVNQ
jgi:hypothetical protein